LRGDGRWVGGCGGDVDGGKGDEMIMIGSEVLKRADYTTRNDESTSA